MRIPHRFMLTLFVASIILLVLTGLRHWYKLGDVGMSFDSEVVREQLMLVSPSASTEEIDSLLRLIQDSVHRDTADDTLVAVAENAASLFALLLAVFIAAHLFLMKPVRAAVRTMVRGRRSLPAWSSLDGGPDSEADSQAKVHDLSELAAARMEEISLLNSLLGQIPAVVFRCRLDDRQSFIYVSESIVSQFGHSTENWRAGGGFDWNDLIDPEDVAMVMDKRRRALSAGEAYSIDYRIHHGDGSTRWVRERGRPVGIVGNDAGGFEGLFFDITARRELERRLKETERRYRGFIASNVAGIWRYTLRNPMPLSLPPDEQVEWLMKESIVSEVNDVFAEWHGFSNKDDVIGMSMAEVRGTSPGAAEAIARDWIESGYGWDRHVIEETVRDGSTRSFLTLGHSVFENECMTEAWGTQIDITERLAAEKELERTRALLEAAIEASPCGVVIADAPDVRIRMANSAALGIRGDHVHHSLTDIPYELHPSYWQLLHPDGSPWRGEELPLSEAVLYGKTFENVEMIMVRDEDEDRLILVNAAPVRNADGEIIAGVAVFPDITEKRRAGDETRRLRALLQNIIDSMPSMLIGVDHDVRITHWNRHTEEVCEIPADEVNGRFVAEAFPALAAIVPRLKRAVEVGSVYKENMTLELPEGNRPVDITIYPLLADGVAGAVLRIDDARDRIRLQDILVQSEKMRSVAGLAAGMAHEINNPIGAVLLGIENILRRTTASLEKNCEVATECGLSLEALNDYFKKRKVDQMLLDIRESGTRAAKIVSNMLQFSRKSDSKMGPAFLPALVENSIELAYNDYGVKRRRNFRSIEIIRDFDENFPMVDCTTTEIEQVLLNLLKNAAEAMFDAGMAEPGHQPRPMLCISLRHEPPNAVITVADNGPGMGEEARRRAFEPFFTTKEPGVGTGLGLAVSYMIVTNNHRGSIRLESAPGEGAKFTIQLPVKSRASDSDAGYIHQGDAV